jgi:hypothetical protein
LTFVNLQLSLHIRPIISPKGADFEQYPDCSVRMSNMEGHEQDNTMGEFFDFSGISMPENTMNQVSLAEDADIIPQFDLSDAQLSKSVDNCVCLPDQEYVHPAIHSQIFYNYLSFY